MKYFWKLSPILKGSLTWVPQLNEMRIRRASTGGSTSARYCYSVWLRHLVSLSKLGFNVSGSCIGELGPGDSIGTGLAGLLSGANQYVGLDIFPFSKKADLNRIFDDLVELYVRKESIPDQREFPGVFPPLDSYHFPDQLIDWTNFNDKVEGIRTELRKDELAGQYVMYRAPWMSSGVIREASLNLIISQAVFEHIDPLRETYKAMYLWLKPGGYASNIIDFGSHGLAPFWNGHLAYSDWEWRLVTGKREFLLNREPLSVHLAYAKEAGFKVVHVQRYYDETGLEANNFAPRFQNLSAEDSRTRSALVVLQKAL